MKIIKIIVTLALGSQLVTNVLQAMDIQDGQVVEQTSEPLLLENDEVTDKIEDEYILTTNAVMAVQTIESLFPDNVFAQAIADELGKNIADEVSLEEIAEITYFSVDNGFVYNLEGLQYLVGLEDIDISENWYLGTTLSKHYFDGLNLSTITIYSQQISEIETAVFSGVNGLESVAISEISDDADLTSVFWSIPTLEYLFINNANIATVPNTFLSGSTNIRLIDMMNSKIFYIEPLAFAELTNLSGVLRLTENSITDLEFTHHIVKNQGIMVEIVSQQLDHLENETPLEIYENGQEIPNKYLNTHRDDFDETNEAPSFFDSNWQYNMENGMLSLSEDITMEDIREYEFIDLGGAINYYYSGDIAIFYSSYVMEMPIFMFDVEQDKVTYDLNANISEAQFLNDVVIDVYNGEEVSNTFSTVDFSTGGTYTVEFIVDGTTARKTVQVVIRPDAPVISPVEAGKNVTVTGTGQPGANITLTYHETKTAQAVVGEDGTWSLVIDELFHNDVLSANQTDEHGNISADATTIVKDTTAPDAPVIDVIEAGVAPVISGTGEVGASVTVTLPSGDTLITEVLADGTWSVTSTEALKVDDVVTATQADATGNVSEIAESIVVDTTAPDAPVIDVIEAGVAPVISGTGEVGASVTVTLPSGDTVTTEVLADGTWSVTSTEALKVDDVVTATQADATGNVSEVVESIVVDTTAPNAPVIDVIEAGVAPVISGTGEVGASVTVTLPSGDTVITEVLTDGTWSVTSTEALKIDDVVTATQADVSGNVSEIAESIVVDTTAPDAPVIDVIKAGTAPAISGTGEVGASVTVTLPSGDTVTTEVLADGTWSVMSTEALKVDDVVTATQTDASGNVSEIAESIVVDTTAPDVPVIDVIEAGAAPVISGTGEVGASVTVTLPSGDTVITEVLTDGTWSVTSTEALKVDDVVTATQTDVSGNVSEVAESIVVDTTAPDAPVIDVIKAGTAPVISGTGEVGAKVAITLPSGAIITTEVLADGTWRVTSTEALKVDDVVTATQADVSGNVSEATAKTVTSDDTDPETPIDPEIPTNPENPNNAGGGTNTSKPKLPATGQRIQEQFILGAILLIIGTIIVKRKNK